MDKMNEDNQKAFNKRKLDEGGEEEEKDLFGEKIRRHQIQAARKED
jgi:hypothetical protein